MGHISHKCISVCISDNSSKCCFDCAFFCTADSRYFFYDEFAICQCKHILFVLLGVFILTLAGVSFPFPFSLLQWPFSVFFSLCAITGKASGKYMSVPPLATNLFQACAPLRPHAHQSDIDSLKETLLNRCLRRRFCKNTCIFVYAARKHGF